VEDLVQGAGRTGHVVVDAPERHRVADRLRSRLVPPDGLRDEQRAPGVGVELTHMLEEVTPPGRRSERRSREHERNVLASVRELLQRPQRLVGIAEGLDPVVVGVALNELLLDVIESVPIIVDCEQDRQAHVARNTTQIDARASARAGGGLW
jgi:hypothetical protein